MGSKSERKHSRGARHGPVGKHRVASCGDGPVQRDDVAVMDIRDPAIWRRCAAGCARSSRRRRAATAGICAAGARLCSARPGLAMVGASRRSRRWLAGSSPRSTALADVLGLGPCRRDRPIRPGADAEAALAAVDPVGQSRKVRAPSGCALVGANIRTAKPVSSASQISRAPRVGGCQDLL